VALPSLIYPRSCAVDGLKAKFPRYMVDAQYRLLSESNSTAKLPDNRYIPCPGVAFMTVTVMR